MPVGVLESSDTQTHTHTHTLMDSHAGICVGECHCAHLNTAVGLLVLLVVVGCSNTFLGSCPTPTHPVHNGMYVHVCWFRVCHLCIPCPAASSSPVRCPWRPATEGSPVRHTQPQIIRCPFVKCVCRAHVIILGELETP